MSLMLQYEVWSPSAQDKLYTVDETIDGDFLHKEMVNSKRKKNLTACVTFFDGCETVYSVLVG